MDWSLVHIGLQARFYSLFIYLLSTQLVQCSSIVGPLSANPQHLVKSCLSQLLSDEDDRPPITGDRKLSRHRRDRIPQAMEDQLERLFQDPLVNATSIDRYINSEHIYNLSSAEMNFFQQSTDEFHRRLFHRLSRWHKKMLNESMIKVQENLEAYSMKHGLKCDAQFDVPAKDGMTIIYNGK
uniref:Uncharacterized protein n=2 Tax=Cacopsylla melanoneura TaxID=428564 RepID=A0A8D8LUN2_9HEMI